MYPQIGQGQLFNKSVLYVYPQYLTHLIPHAILSPVYDLPFVCYAADLTSFDVCTCLTC